MTHPATDPALRQDVTEVLVRYATSIDRKDWARLRTCFTGDCHADYDEVGVWDGVDAIADYMTGIHPEGVRSLHRITNVEVERAGEDVAARSYVDVLYLVTATGAGAHAAGIYDDTLVRTDAGWQIARRHYTMVHRSPIEPR